MKNKIVLATLLTCVMIFSLSQKKAESAFTLSIDSNPDVPSPYSSMDFGAMSPGEWKPISSQGDWENLAKCFSDNGVPWNLSIKNSQPLTHTENPSITIPNTAFMWMATHAGIWINSSGLYFNLSTGLANPVSYLPFTTSDTSVYTSGEDPDYNDSNIEAGCYSRILFKYAIAMPNDQSAGTYTTTVTYTMTE